MTKAINHNTDLHWPKLAVIMILLLFITQMLIRFPSVINHDSAWYIYVAEGILHNKTLYKDFFEPNPPLMIWISLPLVGLADVLGISAQTVIFSFLFVMTAICLVLCNKYLSLVQRIAPFDRSFLICFLCAALLFTFGYHFGQREHFLVLLFLPWFMLRLARCEGIHFKRTSLLNVLVGAMAGLGFCLKPQDLMAPILIELYVIIKHHSIRQLFSPENYSAIVILLCYPVLILIFSPDFFELLPIITSAYPYFSKISFIDGLIFSRATILYMCAYPGLLISVRYVFPSLSNLAFFIAAAATGFLIGYFVQSKGFSYHLTPYLVMAAFGFGVVSLQFLKRIKVTLRNAFAAVIMVTAVFIFCSFAIIYPLSLRPQRYQYDDTIFKTILKNFSPQAKSIYFATAEFSAFPYVVKENMTWASRSPCEWLVPYIFAKTSMKQSHEGDQEDHIVTQVREWMVTDLIEGKPDLVMVNTSDHQKLVPGGYFDYVKFWSKDPRFDPLWKNYALMGKEGNFTIYKRKGF